MIRIVPALFLTFAAVLVPWTAYLKLSLPPVTISHHGNLTWVGYDVGLIGVMAATAWLASRRHWAAPLAAMATTVLLVADAWFDVMSAPSGRALLLAVLRAAVVELPIAVLALYLAVTLMRDVRHEAESVRDVNVASGEELLAFPVRKEVGSRDRLA